MPDSPLIYSYADLLRYFDATDLETAKRTLYKQTDCGAWLRVEGDAVLLSASVEGLEAEVHADALTFPFSYADLEHTIAWVEDRAEELWQETNGEQEEAIQ